jgi:hypothetical protein
LAILHAPPPCGTGELTPEWLTRALRSAGRLPAGTRVARATIEPVGTGQVAESKRVALQYEGPSGDAPATLVGKFPAEDPDTRRSANRLQVYVREVRFYQQIAPRSEVRTAEALYAQIELDSGDFVLLLEDLHPAVQGDQLAGCSVDQAAIALEQAAALHASHWGDRSLERLDWLHQRATLYPRVTRNLPRLLEVFRERYGDSLAREHLDLGEQIVQRAGRYFQEQPRPWTVQHGDYRLDNMLFDAHDGRVPLAVLDWQTIILGPGVLDVSYFLGAGLAAAERRAHQVDLVRGYHAGLCARGVQGYDWERCWEDYRRYSVAGYLMAVGASGSVARTPRGDAMFIAMASRHAEHAVEMDALALIA